MKKIEVVIDGRERLVAQSWNDLTEAQLLRVCLVHGTPYDSPGPLYQALLQAVFQVPLRTIRQLNIVQLVELKPLVRFLKEPSECAPLTKQLLPSLPKISWRQLLSPKLYGPRESFLNLTFTEFIYADTYFLRYLQTNEEVWLQRLVAVLYRPQRADYDPAAVTYGGDRREDFNEHLVEGRVRHVARVPHHLQYAVLLWYRGCRRELERRYVRVFSSDNQQKASQSGWQQVLFSLADGVHRVDVTSRQLLHNVMREMQRVLDNYDRAKEAQQPQ
ncbi:hypothetical protein [Hymenobacter sp. YC55]|uniref:hypothetical protein n=1 Tax=Hymenobacter sp. YC55 TaxID=3034019 RepID=UPI0023F8D8FE|nr:hypothetical protein [Hymenobacter sp. YC55]MDF7810513.1 hypothetical protein [Hymenobacter sp. YC55]